MLRIFHYSPATRSTRRITADELPVDLKKLPDGEVIWIDLENPTEEEETQIFGTRLPVHPLTLEDITRQRRLPQEGAHLPKAEEFDDYLFVIVNPLPVEVCDPKASDQALPRHPWRRPQLSSVLTHQILVTHHFVPLTCIGAVETTLTQRGEVLHRGPDFLYHLILDTMVDEYAPVVERFAGQMDRLEAQLLLGSNPQLLGRLLRMKRRVLFLRKTLVLEREVLARLVRAEFDLVTEQEIHYYRNVYDHLVRYTELIESAREMTSDLMQMHLAAASNRLNEVMKVLTMISIMVGLPTLIAGIYGMNFDHMPELRWTAGYPLSLGLMLVSSSLALAWFKWKKWF